MDKFSSQHNSELKKRKTSLSSRLMLSIQAYCFSPVYTKFATLKNNQHITIENCRATLFSFSFFTLLALLIYHVSESYQWQLELVVPHIISYSTDDVILGSLVQGTYVTLQLVGVSLTLALFIGILLAGMTLSSSPVAQLISRSIVGVIRNTPLLMQLYLFYFVFAPIFGLNPFFSACLTLAFFEGTYFSEIFRAGLKSIPQTQWEAGFSSGFSLFQTGKTIILPQAVQNVLPSLNGQVVSLIKDTSLASAISVAELTLRSTELISETYLTFEIWLIVALFYLCLTSLFSIPLTYYSNRVARRRGKI